MADEVLWPKFSAALDAEREALTPGDGARIRARTTAVAVAMGAAAGVAFIGSIFVPGMLGAPSWALYLTFALVSLPAGIALRIRFNVEDEKAARRVHELAARRRAEREAARTIGALGTGGDSVAVPGIVDDRVREARR